MCLLPSLSGYSQEICLVFRQITIGLNTIFPLTLQTQSVKSQPTIFIRDVAQLGRALRSGRRGRRFKSSHPDHEKKKKQGTVNYRPLFLCFELNLKQIKLMLMGSSLRHRKRGHTPRVLPRYAHSEAKVRTLSFFLVSFGSTQKVEILLITVVLRFIGTFYRNPQVVRLFLTQNR